MSEEAKKLIENTQSELLVEKLQLPIPCTKILLHDNYNGLVQPINALTNLQHIDLTVRKSCSIFYIKEELVKDTAAATVCIKNSIDKMLWYITRLVFYGDVKQDGYYGIIKSKLTKHLYWLWLSDRQIKRLMKKVKSNSDNQFYVNAKTYKKLEALALKKGGDWWKTKVNVLDQINDKTIIYGDLKAYVTIYKNQLDLQYSLEDRWICNNDDDIAFRLILRSAGTPTVTNAIGVLRTWW